MRNTLLLLLAFNTTLSAQETGLRGGKIRTENGLVPESLQNEVFSVRCFPNPGSGFAQFGITTRQGGKYRVSLNDAAGQRLLLQDLNFAGPGEQTLQLQGSEKLPAGIYLWRAWNSTHKLQGIWIKQWTVISEQSTVIRGCHTER
jgi:hypothetical protein